MRIFMHNRHQREEEGKSQAYTGQWGKWDNGTDYISASFSKRGLAFRHSHEHWYGGRTLLRTAIMMKLHCHCNDASITIPKKELLRSMTRMHYMDMLWIYFIYL